MTVEISPGVAATLARLRDKMLINGEWVPALSGRTQAVVNPADGQPFASVPAAEPEDVDRAVKAARAAFENKAWAQMRPADRERLLLKLADLVEANAAEFAELETLDNGKPIMLSSSGRRARLRRIFAVYCGLGHEARRKHGRRVVSAPPPGRRIFRLHAARAGRRRRGDHSLELSADDGGVEDWPGAGDGLHDRPETRERDPDDRLAAGGTRHRGGIPARRRQCRDR